MLFANHRSEWEELDSLGEPTVGRALPVGGFVFGNSFDALLRNISADYLGAVWKRLSDVLEQNQMTVRDLSWGWMYPGETGFADSSGASAGHSAPSDYFGWTSCELSEIWRSNQLSQLDEILKAGVPPLRCTATWRSLKWRIAPDNFPLALNLVEALCVEDIVEWSPNVVLAGVTAPPELWRTAALAIQNNDQEHLDRIVKEAQKSYTTLGFRIFVLGYTKYLNGGGYTGALRVPSIE